MVRSINIGILEKERKGEKLYEESLQTEKDSWISESMNISPHKAKKDSYWDKGVSQWD